MTRSTLLIMATLLLIVGSAAADDAGQESVFSFGAGARPLAMGGSFVAIADDASAVYYNPAGIAGLSFQEVSFMHADLFEGTIYNFGAWAYPVSNRDGIAIGFMRIGTDDIMRRENGFDMGTFGYSSSQLLLTYGRQFGSRLQVGATFKAVNQSLDNLSDWAVGADVGANLRLNRYLAFGMVVRDVVQPELKLESTGEQIPRSAATGLALRDFPLFNSATMTAAVELEQIDARDLKFHAGGELAFHHAYMLRAGYDREQITLGAGVKIGPIKVDYAYRPVDYVDNIHIFSFSFLLGKTSEERFRPPEPIVLQPEPPPPLTEEEKRFRAVRDKASDFFHALQLDSALVYYRRALALQPENEQIRQTIVSIEADLAERQAQKEQLAMAEEEIRQFTGRYLSQAKTFEQKKYYSSALDLLDLVLDIDPSNFEALQMQDQIRDEMRDEIAASLRAAEKAKREGRTADAVDALGRILELDPDNDSVRTARQEILSGLDVAQQLNLAIELYKRGRMQEARRRFSSVLRSDPNNSVAKEYLGNIDALRDKPSTLEDLQKNPEIWQLYLEGIRHMRDKQYQMAIDAWEKVLEVYPGNEDTKNNIDQARLRMKSEQTE